MAERYWYGGPIPVTARRLKERREYRSSSLYAGVKKARRERFAERIKASELVAPYLHDFGHAAIRESRGSDASPPERDPGSSR